MEAIVPDNQRKPTNIFAQDLESFKAPQAAEMFSRTMQAGGVTHNEAMQMGQRGGQIGGQMGFDPRIGMATAMQSAGFGQAFQQRGGGGLSPAQARQLDQELRLSAANSP